MDFNVEPHGCMQDKFMYNSKRVVYFMLKFYEEQNLIWQVCIEPDLI